MRIDTGKYLKAADGWTEIARNDDLELAVVQSAESGVLRLVALVDPEDHDLGEFFTLQTHGIRPGPRFTPEDVAAEMLNNC